jgi:hypothetical protein
MLTIHRYDIEFAWRDARVTQYPGYGAFWKARPVLLAGESLLLQRGDHPPIFHQRCSSVVTVVNAKDQQGAPLLQLMSFKGKELLLLLNSSDALASPNTHHPSSPSSVMHAA